MTAAHQNPPTQPKQLRVTPPQMTALALFDSLGSTTAFAADLLTAMGQADAAEVAIALMKELQARKVELIEKWGRAIQVVGADALPPAPVILSKG